MHVQSNAAAQDATRLHRRACDLLERASHGDSRGNVLIIGHGSQPLPDCPSLKRDDHNFSLSLSLHIGANSAHSFAVAGDEPVTSRRVGCSSANLPFQEGVFHHVILYHAIRDGTEPELAEAGRVLRVDGELWILGTNHASWSGLIAGRNSLLPLLHWMRLREQLGTLDMEIKTVLGAGLLGQSGPYLEQQRMIGLALPVADLLLVKVRHRQRFSHTRLHLEKFSTGAIPTALVEGRP